MGRQGWHHMAAHLPYTSTSSCIPTTAYAENDMEHLSGGAERAAMVNRRPDGRWEVMVSELEPVGQSRTWRHKKMFDTEQEAERYARSILPYCDTCWDLRQGMNDDLPETSRRVYRPERRRRSRHLGES